MAVVGYATVQLIPSMEGFSKKVRAQISGVNEEIATTTNSASKSAGEKAGGFFGASWMTAMTHIVASMAVYQTISSVVSGVKDAVTAGFADASFLQTSKIALETLTHSAATAKTLLSDLYNFAEKTPFDAQGVVALSQQLLGAGETAKDIIPTLNALGNATAAVGGSQDDLNHTVRAWTQLMTRGKVDTQDLYQIANSGIPVMQELAKALHKPQSSMADLISSGTLLSSKTLPLLQAQMEKDYGGLMIKESSTLAGAWSNVQDSVNQALGKAFLPLAEWLATKLPAAATIASSVISGIASGIGDITSGVQAAVQWFKKLFGDPALKAFKAGGMIPNPAPKAPKPPDLGFKRQPLRPNIATKFSGPAMKVPVIDPTLATKFAGRAIPTPRLSPLAAMAPPLAQRVLGPAMPVAPESAMMKSVDKSTNDIKKTSSAWGAFGSDFVKVMNTIGKAYTKYFAPIIDKYFPKFANLATGTLPPAADALDKVFVALGAVVAALAPILADILGPAIQVVVDAFSGAMTAIGGALKVISGVFDLIFGLVSGNGPKIRKAFGKIFSGLGDIGKGLLGGLMKTFGDAFMGIVKIVVGVGADIIGGFNKGWNKAIKGFGKVILKPFEDGLKWVLSLFGIHSPSTVFRDIALNLILGFLKGWGSNLAGIAKAIGSLGRKVLSWIGNANTWLIDRGRDVITGFLNGLGHMWGSVTSWFHSLPGKVKSALGGIGHWLYDSGKSLVQGFIHGIESIGDGIYKSVKGLLSKAAKLFPHSPALEGPFSGKGWTLFSGQALAQGFADGIAQGSPAVYAAANAMLPASVLAGTNVLGMSGAAAHAAPAIQQTFITNNPVAQDPMQSIRNGAQAARAHMSLGY